MPRWISCESPPPGVDLIAECRLLKLGRVLAVGDVLIRSGAAPEPVARATLTYSIPPAPLPSAG